VWPLKGPFRWLERRSFLLGAGVLGHSLGALGHGVLGELTRQQQAHGSLDLPARDGGALVVVGQTASLGGDALEDVVDEGVHDAHGLAGHTGVGVDLLQHLVDVDGIALLPPALLSLLVRFGDVLLGLARLLGGLSTGLGRHGERRSRDETGENLRYAGNFRL